MELTADLVAEKCSEYPDHQPLSAVEEEHLEMLPNTFASGDYGWRDAEWVVQWYYRRLLGGYANAERRAAEESYDENTYEDVHVAIAGAVEAETAADKLESLTALSGVDVPVATAFLQFLAPDRYVVVSQREWGALHRAGELDDEYPDPPAIADYQRYLETVQSVADRCDCDVQALYRALWLFGED